MTIAAQIEGYIMAQPEPKRSDMRTLHTAILQAMPGCPLWFLDGKNDEGKTVSNPNIGYGLQNLPSAGGKTREFYQIGMSANQIGISVYILGIADKQFLAQAYAHKIGKASVSGYCIKFKSLEHIDLAVLLEAIRYGARQTSV
ncbi:DUF1801 domain-containing protein [Flavobacterium sp.]|uniref:DUF1801 domain-containing protein n=1 Tax=Flavobacterium sp. TaxID=239 RepID=UPI0039E663D4